MHSWSW